MIGPCFNPEDDCPMKKRERRSNSHHLYWPRYKYQTPLETAFRELNANKLQMCVCAHNDLHRETYPPKMPSVTEMCLALTVEL